KAVKLPKPEVSAAECLTVPSSPKHVWKVKLSLYGATTLADIRKKADSIQAQLGAPWLRVREDEDGEVWLYMGDPSSSAKFRRGGENEVANLDFEQAWLDSSVKNRSGRTPQLVKMETLETNPDISVLDFSFPPGLDFQRVKSAREQLRANFRAEFVDVAPIGSTGVKMFMAKEDPLPKMAGVPWDDLPSTNIAFGVNALGEQVFFDIEDSPHLLVLGSSGSGKAQPLTAASPCRSRSGSRTAGRSWATSCPGTRSSTAPTAPCGPSSPCPRTSRTRSSSSPRATARSTRRPRATSGRSAPSRIGSPLRTSPLDGRPHRAREREPRRVDPPARARGTDRLWVLRLARADRRRRRCPGGAPLHRRHPAQRHQGAHPGSDPKDDHRGARGRVRRLARRE